MAGHKNQANIEKMVKNILAESLDIDSAKIENAASLIEDIGIDSFGFAELSFAVQEKFSFEIPVEDARNLKTVGDLMKYVCSKIKEV